MSMANEIYIQNNKILSHLERVMNDNRPITADVFLTNYCNNKCKYCVYDRWDIDKTPYSMKYEDFVKYAERLRSLGVLGIILTGGGEPTICNDFMQITKWMEANGYHYGINTNFNKLVYIKPDYLKISLDGYDEDSYEKNRGVRKYGEVISNIEEYAKWRKTESPNTQLGVQWVAMTPEDVWEFYEANNHLDVDYFSIRPIESTAGSYYCTEEMKQNVSEIISEIDKIKKEDNRVMLNFKWNLLSQQEENCTAQWAQIAINEHGKVMYCCHKPYEIVGDIMDDNILELKEKAITNMNMCDIPCRMTAPNKFVNEIHKLNNKPEAYFI